MVSVCFPGVHSVLKKNWGISGGGIHFVKIKCKSTMFIDNTKCLDIDLQSITNLNLRERVQQFIFLLKENRLPLPCIDYGKNLFVVAMWRTQSQLLNVFLDDEEITTHWCAMKWGFSMESEDQDYSYELSDSKLLLLYLRLKFTQMKLI
jgi:hypothetical protein